ncbi:MAG: TetR/AcrR family transcriptional regulator, partial [Actinomyces massiliensis]
MPKIMGSSLAEHRERTRTALFDALAELMAKHSFDKITLSDVAAHAGVGRTAVYNHFADKEDLLLAFMEHETARYAEELSASLAGVEDP